MKPSNHKFSNNVQMRKHLLKILLDMHKAAWSFRCMLILQHNISRGT